ncbi:hypothetical protein [Moraxella sp. ZY210820]|uniref:hypothetical protein n=1 Tax=unclassified Moraxella TaxID=2685852 RepID=UPI00273076DD|nr:hypothetical protein [Moraxella sp. ZY210820]WLF83928.1 hypothetical protein LU301_11980 [Moraxella sp. ZY210820]
MTIEFGKVEKYIQHRGFGFVSCCFKNANDSYSFISNNHKVFFHIKAIKKFNYEIFNKLENSDIDDIYFWFEIEKTDKGEQVLRLLKSDDKQIKNNPTFIEILKNKFLDISTSLPKWVEIAINDVLDKKEIEVLKNERNILEQIENQKRIERQREIQAENDRLMAIRQQEIQKRKELEEIQEREFEQLVNEIQSFGFTHSNQVSNYIKRNRLGNKYRHLAGVLKMSRGSDTWDFVGGIDPKFYARLCSTLNLSSQNSGATPTNFKSFNDLNK